MRTEKELLKIGKCTHTNLTVFQAVIAILEGGCIYAGVDSHVAAERIIAICKRENQRLLKKMDAADAALGYHRNQKRKTK